MKRIVSIEFIILDTCNNSGLMLDNGVETWLDLNTPKVYEACARFMCRENAILKMREISADRDWFMVLAVQILHEPFEWEPGV